MEISNQAVWQEYKEKNTDSYGGEVLRFAQAWADLMEARMAAGDKLEDIAQETSHTANTSHISGYMYGAAVGCLAQVWVHGDELRAWHNRKYHVDDPDEKGIVNPALLNITLDETGS